jgi:hypothetical protein
MPKIRCMRLADISYVGRTWSILTRWVVELDVKHTARIRVD